MSTKKHDTKLGYDAPRFPSEIDAINSTYADDRRLSKAHFDQIGRRIPGFISQDNPSTEDGYVWFCGQSYRFDKGEVKILFPWAQDFEKSDGTQADRSVAVYPRGVVPSIELSRLLLLITEGIKQTQLGDEISQ